jgi:hypothetical protein
VGRKGIQKNAAGSNSTIIYCKKFVNVTMYSQYNNKKSFKKIKNLLHNKKMASKLKRPPTEWEKIFASYTSDKGLITKIYREFKKLNSFKINEPIKKGATELNRTFSKEEIQSQKPHEEMFTISSHIGNANQTHTKISHHPC